MREQKYIGSQTVTERLDAYARLMDSQFRIPFTPIRLGVDSLIGLLPGIGDGAAFLMSLYPVFEARKMGAGKGLIVKMLFNILVDFLIGLIPLIGDVFDIGFKANIRNVRLLKEHLNRMQVS